MPVVTSAKVAWALSVLYSGALRATVVIAAAWIALRLLRGASAAARSAVCAAALVALATLQLLRGVPLGWAAEIPAAVAGPFATLGAVGIASSAAAAGAHYESLGRVSEELVTTYPRVLAALLALWAAGAAAVLLALGRGAVAARRIAARSAAMHDAGWLRLLGEARAALGVRRPVRLLRDAAPWTPLTWGVRRPVIVLPAAADGWPEAHRRAVLLHELAHVGAADALAGVLARLACAALWFHPGAWWLA
ncbi:MAG TPA: M56 family metallopeptidase, partial [Gemmatimonadaceae bacterium]|nr:M56 family metallopeptidase [Gemmatimonadaceae bacterium]